MPPCNILCICNISVDVSSMYKYRAVADVSDVHLPCSADRNGADFVIKERRCNFQELGILRRFKGSQCRFNWLLLLLLPNELPPRDLNRRWRRNQWTVPHCCQHDRVGVVMRQTRLPQFLRCISLQQRQHGYMLIP